MSPALAATSFSASRALSATAEVDARELIGALVAVISVLVVRGVLLVDVLLPAGQP